MLRRNKSENDRTVLLGRPYSPEGGKNEWGLNAFQWSFMIR